jgi:hypothetical protein
MSDANRPLPTPPRQRFGAARGDDETAGGLTADRIAQAAAEGRLEQFLQSGIPEGEHARNLALMMLGISGVTPAPAPVGPASATSEMGTVDAGAAGAPAGPLPPELLAAAREGDVAGLVSLLRAEHGRRTGEPAPEHAEPPGQAIAPATDAAAPAAAHPTIDAALVDELVRVAADSDVSVDWLVLRAVRFYLEEHRRSGRL